MFNLEQAIADWRQKMLTAGIDTPVPLEELELHLREEVERLVKTGLNATQAFDEATKSMGEAHSLKTEFKKVSEKSRDKFFRIIGTLMYCYIGLSLCQDGYSRIAATNFKLIYINGRLSYDDLLIGPVHGLYGGLCAWVTGLCSLWLAWAWFRHYPMPCRAFLSILKLFPTKAKD